MAAVECAERGGDLKNAAVEAGLVYVDDSRPASRAAGAARASATATQRVRRCAM